MSRIWQGDTVQLRKKRFPIGLDGQDFPILFQELLTSLLKSDELPPVKERALNACLGGPRSSRIYSRQRWMWRFIRSIVQQCEKESMRGISYT